MQESKWEKESMVNEICECWEKLREMRFIFWLRLLFPKSLLFPMEIWYSENYIRLRFPSPFYKISKETMRQRLCHVRHTNLHSSSLMRASATSPCPFSNVTIIQFLPSSLSRPKTFWPSRSFVALSNISTTWTCPCSEASKRARMGTEHERERERERESFWGWP